MKIPKLPPKKILEEELMALDIYSFVLNIKMYDDVVESVGYLGIEISCKEMDRDGSTIIRIRFQKDGKDFNRVFQKSSIKEKIIGLERHKMEYYRAVNDYEKYERQIEVSQSLLDNIMEQYNEMPFMLQTSPIRWKK